jgi:hypothetical protein
MQGADFHQYIEKFPILKKHFKGIFSIDTLPKRLNYRQFLIANTDVQSGIGKHWIIFYRCSKICIELFDSLSLNEDKKQLLLKYCKFRQEIIFNETQFQSENSSSCGYFVIYFCIEQSFNLDLDFLTFLQFCFDENCEKNELKVTQFCADVLLDKF